MRKFFNAVSRLALVALIATSIMPLGPINMAQAVAPNWNTTGNYVVRFVLGASNYDHDLTLSQDGSGNLTGNGGYPAGGAHTYSWVLTSGSVSADTIDFLADYTASADAVTPQTTMHVNGTIAPGGSMSGTWTDNYQGGSRAGTWSTISGNALAIPANDTNVDVVVRPSTLTLAPGGWYFYNDVTDTPTTTTVPGAYDMVTGPGSPPKGNGSVEMSVTGSERFNIASYQFAGTDLSAIGALAFSTYEPSSNPDIANRAIYLNFDIDFDNTNAVIPAGYKGRLVYVPADNGSVNEDTWQSWNTLTGQWRWSGYDAAGSVWPDGNASALRSWTDIKAAFPNAEVFNESFTGQMLLRAGEPYPEGFTGNVDKFVFKTGTTTTTYDFEPDLQPTPIDVSVNKVWQDANGTPIEGPSNKDDITITVTEPDNDTRTCNYNANGELDCSNTITGDSTETFGVSETGLPAGWTVDDSTVGSQIAPICPAEPNSKETVLHCTITVINKQNLASPCNTELVANRGFELPEVTNPAQWDLFPSGTPDLSWSVDNAGTNTNGNLEIQEGVFGWAAHGGNQFAEVDSDTNVNMYQDLITQNNGVYTVTLWTSPRPGVGSADNSMQIKMGGTLLGTIAEDGSNLQQTVWTKHTFTFTATGDVSRLEIIGTGTSNGLGGLVDDVSVIQDCLSEVTICKYDDSQNPLGGWNVFLKGPQADSVEVNPDGTDYATAVLPAGSYVLEASGKYVYRPGDSSASESDTAYSKRLASDGVYGGPFVPWVRENDFPVPYVGWLGIQVNDGFYDWGSTFNPTHEYSGNFTLGADAPINFRILDDNYSDNSGHLTVDVYPVYHGVTGQNGCVTLHNIPYGTYKLDEIMQDGWENVSGQGDSVIVDQPTEPGRDQQDSFVLVNECVSEQCAQPIPLLHLVKVVCNDYSDIVGNASANSFDATDGHYDEFNNYNAGGGNPFFDPLQPKPVDPLEIPANCHLQSGWHFALSSDINQDNDYQDVGPTAVNGEFVTPIAGLGSVLSANLQSGIHNGNFWVSEIMPGDSNIKFGALRCYNDALNGDNLEFINVGDANPTNIYCIAYNVQPAVPCVDSPINVASGTVTQFLGLKEGDPAPVSLTNPLNYPLGTPGNATGVGPTGYPGAWDGAINDPDVSGALFVSNDAIQPTNSGGSGHDGTVNSWRLFSHNFTIPAGATNISSPVLHFAADNEATAFLDDVPIGFTTSFSSVFDTGALALTPGTHTLKFAVKNYAFEPQNNPTGLIYKLQEITYSCGDNNDAPNLILVKNFDNNPNDVSPDQFSFTLNDGSAESFDSDGQTELTLPTGEYDVQEVQGMLGWSLESVHCQYESQSAGTGIENGEHVNLVDDDPVICTFTNTFTGGDGNRFTLNVDTSGDGEGVVTSNDGGINCDSNAVETDCTETYPEGTVVDLTATPDAGSNFDNTWAVSAGTCTGNTTPCQVTMNSNIDLNAHFDLNSGGSSGGGSRSGSGSKPDDGQVLGDFTDVPSGQVAGASTTLPVTGSPTWVLLMIALLAAPMYYFRSLAVVKSAPKTK